MPCPFPGQEGIETQRTTCNDIQPLRAHFGQRGPGGLRRVDGEESRAALPGWTRRRRRRSNTKREKRRRAVVSSGDYGDFVVSETRRAGDRFCINIVVTTAVLHFVFSPAAIWGVLWQQAPIMGSSSLEQVLSRGQYFAGVVDISKPTNIELCQSPTNGG